MEEMQEEKEVFQLKYQQLKETSDLQKIKGVLFEHCARAADQNIIAQNSRCIEVMVGLDRR